MKATPAASFEMAEPNFLLKVLIVALDTPAQFGQINKTSEGDLFGNGREPILCWFLLALGPLNQQPFFRACLGKIIIAMGDTHPHAGKARGEPFGRSFAPSDRAPRLRRQAEGEVFN